MLFSAHIYALKYGHKEDAYRNRWTMQRKRLIAVVLVLLIAGSSAVGVMYLLQGGDEVPEGEEDEQIIPEEITPHPFNNLNWWDLPSNFSSLSEYLDVLNHFATIGTRYDYTDGYYEAADYVMEYLEARSIGAEFWGAHESVVGIQEGYGDDDRAIVFGAHLDGPPSTTGIDQNAGGCGTVLIAAKILSQFRLPIDIYYCFFQGNMIFLDEQQKNRAMYGSQEVSQILSNMGVDILAMYNFDEVLYHIPGQVGPELDFEYEYPGDKNYQTTKYLADLLYSFMSGYEHSTVIDRVQRETTQTDHWAFWDRGFPAVNVKSGVEVDEYLGYSDSVFWDFFYKTQGFHLGRAAASVAVYLGMKGNGENTIQKLHAELKTTESATLTVVNTVPQTFSLHGSVPENATLAVTVKRGGNAYLPTTQFSEGNFSVNTTSVAGEGLVTLQIQNVGSTNDTFEVLLEYASDTDGDGVLDAAEYDWPSPDPPLDWDGDGLPDSNETALGTDIFVTDTDADGISDRVEVENGLDPLLNDAAADYDRDGITNEVEISMSMNPISNDSDSDGMGDGWELQYDTNPLVNDSGEDADGDGLTNLEEFTYGSNPQSSDSDGDGVGDAEEVSRGMNPMSNDSDGDGLSDLLELLEGLDPLQPDYDHDLDSDGNDPNPVINTWIIIGLLTLIPVIIGSAILRRRIL